MNKINIEKSKNAFLKKELHKPAISVVMAMHDVEKYIKESIGSISYQTFKDFELIAVDDKSNDNTLKIAQNLAKKDKRIKILKNNKNIGATCSRNRAIKIARGKYIAIMDSDDISLPDRFQKQYEYLENHPEIFLVGGSYEYIDENGKKIYTEIYDYNWKKTARMLIYNNIVHNPTVMFRNDKETFYREKVTYSEDRDLWMVLLSRGKKLEVLPNIAIKYRMHPTSATVNKYLKLQMFSEKAVEWFFERKKYGKDSYDTFDPKTITGLEDKNIFTQDYVQKQQIKLLLHTDKKRFRKEIIKYIRMNGVKKWKRAPLLLISSYIPIDFISLQNRFSKWLKYYVFKRG